ncbi:hypothetical protein VSDG_05395 [Cytospora chrysosperma]|uniref:Methyltransferase domain-containing protein n=1 Tax=Cytospora chrysosperma TaxID=252740 RepID=A0A423VZF9_CYTCH|nr:hypothetical protein VSDG_05395 [Valsa sordida]
MEASFGTETQTQSAQRMYNARATKYEDSWHPAYSRRFISLVPLKAGDRVLDLCCGTGLEAFLAADIVGPGGEVVGVDVSSGMLERLRERQQREPELGGRIKALHHDVTDLEGASGVAEGSFDAVLCSCAFVLFDDPAGVVAHWKEHLKPGGIMAIDVPHEWSLRPGLVLERLAKKMGMKYPSNRAWIYSIDSCKVILEWQGMEVVSKNRLDNTSGKGSSLHGVGEADELYDNIVNSSLTQNAVLDDFKVKAKPLFRQEWERIAVDGKVEITDVSYVYIARKPE